MPVSHRLQDITPAVRPSRRGLPGRVGLWPPRPRWGLLVGLSLVFVACATVAPVVSPPRVGERRWQAASRSFSTVLPKDGWTRAGETPNSLRLQLQGLPLFLQVSGSYLQPGDEKRPLPALAEESLERWRHAVRAATIDEEGADVVAGRPGWRIQLSGQTEGVPVHILTLAARAGPRLFTVQLSGADPLLSRGLAAWRRASDALAVRRLPGDAPPAGGAVALSRAAGQAATVEHDPAKAAAWLARAVALAPGDVSLRDRLVEADLSAGLFSRAVGALRAELRKAPGRFDRWELLGALLVQAGRPADAVRAWQEAASIPGCPAAIFENLGALLAQRHDLSGAAAAFREATARAPRDAAAFSGLGEVYLKERQLMEAERAELRAAELDPADAETHAVLSEIYGDMNRYAQAADECMAALQREVSKELSATLRYNLACYQARLGHERECLWWLRQALEAGFRDVQLMKTDPDLASVRGTPAFNQLLGL